MLYFLLLPFLLFSQNLEEYSLLEKNHPLLFQNKGSFQQGEIELVTNNKRIHSIQKKTEERLAKKGLPLSYAQVGIVAEDQYLYWIRDAVIFPSGFEGTYDRIASKKMKGMTPGVAVLIELPNGKLLCNINYRHATRSWELEIPRGGIEDNEPFEKTAYREALEETGYKIDTPILLGVMNPDSGILSSQVPIYFAKTRGKQDSEQENTEAIFENRGFSKDELKKLLSDGVFSHSIKGYKKKIYVRDPFLTYALLLAEIKNLI